MNKYIIGDEIIYDGLIGIVESVGTVAGTNKPLYRLVAKSNSELSCSAIEDELERYNGQDIDETDALSDARFSSMSIRNMGESLTDKYFRDGNH